MKVLFLLGSEVDKDFTKKITAELDLFEVEHEVIVASAHKVPEKVLEIVTANNASDENMVYITVAGRSNGLSGVVAANSVHPVIACPPHKDKADFMVNINSTLQMPGDTPAMAVVDPKNAALAAVRILANSDTNLRQMVIDRIAMVKASFNS